MAKPSIFISYKHAQSDSAYVDNVEKQIKEYANVVRDKNDVETWGSFAEFMKQIREGDFAILCVSSEYLQSINCMYEVSQLMRDENWHGKVMSVILNGTNIYNSGAQAEYINYWEEERKKIEKLLESLPLDGRDKHTDELKKIKEIQLKIAEFIKVITDINNPKPEIFIDAIIKRITGKLSPDEQKQAEMKSLENEAQELMRIPIRSDSETLLSSADRLNYIAVYFMNNARYEEAMMISRRLLDVYEKVPSIGGHYIAATYNNIAAVYKEQGCYAEALVWYNKALAIFEKMLDVEHPCMAAIYNNIAILYNCLGKYSDGLEWSMKALAIREKVLGVEHQDTAKIYINIADMYNEQGCYAEALVWYNKALTIYEAVFGIEHHETADAYNNIATVYYKQGDYKNALERFNKVLIIYESVFGIEHHKTADIYNNIALVYSRKGNHEDALPLFNKALVIYKAKLGSEHPDTKLTQTNIDECCGKRQKG